MSYGRLTLGHWIAAVAAVVLLFAMGSDWYGTRFADQLRRDEGLIEAPPNQEGRAGRVLEYSIPPAAEAQEQNAWEAYWTPGLDLILLALLVASVALGLLSAYLRAAGRRLEAPPSASALAAAAGLLAILGVLFRLVQQPGDDALTTVRPGAFVGLLALGALVFGAARAMKAEESEPTAPDAAGAPPGAGAAPGPSGVGGRPPR